MSLKEREPGPRPEPEREGEGLELALHRCPYCHEDVGAGDEHLVCEQCLVRQHTACWDETGRCGSCQGTQPLGRVEKPAIGEPEKIKNTIWWASLGFSILVVAPILLYVKHAFGLQGWARALGLACIVGPMLFGGGANFARNWPYYHPKQRPFLILTFGVAALLMLFGMIVGISD